MFDSSHCSPISHGDKSTCMSLKLLKKIARILNKYNKGGRKIKTKSTKKKLHKDITSVIKDISNCSNERCWITIHIIQSELSDKDNDLFQRYFKPKKPDGWKRNPNKWLTTIDINNVMYQYEEAYPHFKYMGAHPIDFDKKIEGGVCVSDDLCNIDIKKLGKKKKSLGMVFNTDPHYKSGQHWFSIYVDLMGKNQKNKPCIYYFDSVAKDPPEEIIILINRIKEQCNLINKKINVAYNDIEHQSGNTECGIYCLHFLISMLKGKNFKNYIHNVRTDNEIEKFRNIFYSTI